MTFPVSGEQATDGSQEAAAGTAEDVTSESSSDDSFDWGEFGESLDSDGDAPIVDAGEEPGATPTGAEQQQEGQPQGGDAQTPPAPEQAQQPTQQQQPQQPTQQQPQGAQPQQQQQQAPEQQQTQQPQQQETPEQYQERMQQVEQQWAQELSQSYALSEDEATMLQESPAEALPQLAAKMHMRVTREVFENLRQNLPNWVNEITQVSQTYKSNEDEFFTSWPELKEHEALTAQVGQMWRQMNPQASKEEFIKAVGAIAWSQAGLPMDKLLQRQSGGGQQQQGQQQQQPAGESMGVVQTPQQQTRHPSPAGAHAGAIPNAHPQVSPQGEEAYWARFAEKFDEDF